MLMKVYHILARSILNLYRDLCVVIKYVTQTMISDITMSLRCVAYECIGFIALPLRHTTTK